ncbi:hypothetical protein EDD85DRAFT_1003718 [Armillaria nabsnona]|nr:hypothetical protein EDD85DRAFT_1003718 [Armillaria nabsnona]
MPKTSLANSLPFATASPKPVLLSSYNVERRENLRAVQTSARYLRFVGNCTFESLDGLQSLMNIEETKVVLSPGEDGHVAFFRQFAAENIGFLIGLGIRYATNAVNKLVESSITGGNTGILVAGTGPLIHELPSPELCPGDFGEIKVWLQMYDSYLASSPSLFGPKDGVYDCPNFFKVKALFFEVGALRSTMSEP